MNPRVCRWGILATGGIAESFVRDLLIDPKTRDMHDLRHVVVAVASSSGIARAKQFLSDVAAGPEATAYGTYTELIADQNIDIVYVATPHSHHYRNVMQCLRG